MTNTPKPQTDNNSTKLKFNSTGIEKIEKLNTNRYNRACYRSLLK